MLKLVLFDSHDYAHSNGGTVTFIAPYRGKLQISSFENRNFVGGLGFEYEVARLDRSSGTTKIG